MVLELKEGLGMCVAMDGGTNERNIIIILLF